MPSFFLYISIHFGLNCCCTIKQDKTRQDKSRQEKTRQGVEYSKRTRTFPYLKFLLPVCVCVCGKCHVIIIMGLNFRCKVVG